jgi:hypothetical protein
MSRKPKIIPPIAGSFNDILSSIASGAGVRKPRQNPRILKKLVSKKEKP